MPPLYRILEVALYALLNFLPPMVLALCPFRKQHRFSVPATAALVVAVSLLQILTGLLSSFTPLSDGLLSILSTLLYILFYFVAVKDHPGKLLFTLLMLSNVTNFIVISAKCLEGLIFGDMALEAYRWSMSVCMVLVHCLITLPLYFYFRTHYAGAMAKTQIGLWRYLWAIPATFYLVWYHNCYFSGLSTLQLALDPLNTLFLFFVNLGAFLVYHMLIRLIVEQDKSVQLETQNYQLAMQKLQYDNLQDRINEARQAKHDVRHHVHLIQEYLQNGKLEELQKYLETYRASLPDEQSMAFCENYAANALLCYFSQQAAQQQVEFDCMVHLPGEISLPDTVLSVVLGNLIENALEACTAIQEGEKRIVIRGKMDSGCVFFEITNTYTGNLRQSKTGLFLSTKHKGRGLGLYSVRNIAAQYNGVVEIGPADGLFRAAVLLSEP